MIFQEIGSKDLFKKLKTTAAVLFKTKSKLKLVNLEIPKLSKGQVLVKLSYSGICRSQIMEISGQRGKDKWLPHLLGHEAVGHVISIGKNVKKVKKNDNVILSWIKGKGIEAKGAVYKYQDININSGPITTFSKYTIVSENRVYKINKTQNKKLSVLCGCALPTGYGMAHNELKIKTNDKRSILVFGLGGIGLSTLMALKEKNVKDVTVIDKSIFKLNFAKQLGYNTYSNTEKLDKKFDIAIESAGKVSTIEKAFSLIKTNKGKLVFASHPKKNQKISIDPHELISGKSIKGSWGGGFNLDKNLNILLNNIKKLNKYYDQILPKVYKLQEINEAIKDIKNNNVFRAIIKFD